MSARFSSTTFIQQHLSHYMVNANIKCIILYISEQTNAELTNKIRITHYLLIFYSSDDVIFLTVEKILVQILVISN